MPSIVMRVKWVDTLDIKAVYFLTASGEGGWQARKRSCDKKNLEQWRATLFVRGPLSQE
jgi:hypothetical protein